MIKAPFMALVIGVVACVEGLAVKGSVGIAWPANDGLGRGIDFPGDRARRLLCHFLCLDRNVKMAGRTAKMS